MDAPSNAITANRTEGAARQASRRGLSGGVVQRSEHNLQSVVFWSSLRIFAEAVLALSTDRHSRKQSLLREVLPSLPETFSRCGFRAAFLRDDLASWTARAKRLLRQASWHCAESGGQLVERLRQIERHARQTVDAISMLQHAEFGTVVSTQTRQNAHADGSQPHDGTELTQLARFCQAIVELGPSETQSDPVLIQVFPTAHLLFQRCTPELLARLRSELSASESQVAGLVELAGAHWAPAADELQRSMRRTHSLAASVLDALEVLYSCSLDVPSADHEVATHAAQSARDTRSVGEHVTEGTANNRARAEVNCRMGIRSQRQGQLIAAQRFYSQALTLVPDFQPARQALQRLDGEQVSHSDKKANGEARDAPSFAIKDSAGESEDEILHVLTGQSRAQQDTVDQKASVAKAGKKRNERVDLEPPTAVTPSASYADRKTPHERASTLVVPSGSPSPEESHVEANKGQIAIECPNCGRQSSMRWNLMEKGKVFGCPRCQAKLAVREGGHLAKVVQGKEGTWKVDVPPPPWKDRRVVAGAAGASTFAVSLILLVAILGWRQVSAKSITRLPADLQSRSLAFCEAWLGKDYQVLRTLTLPSQMGQLFPWLRTNPVPENTRGVKIEAAIVRQGPQSAEVELKLVEPFSPDLTERKVVIHCLKEGDQWLFAPAGKTVATVRNASPGSSIGQTRQSARQRVQTARRPKVAPYP